MNELFAEGIGGSAKMYKTHTTFIGDSPIYFGYILKNGQKGGIINLSSVVASNPSWKVVDEFATTNEPLENPRNR